MNAKGSFEVKLAPQTQTGPAEEAAIGRMSLDKQFHGDLEATSKGEMISISTEANHSAAYVAIERVTGTLQGRSGTFALMHSGTVLADDYHLTVAVAPGSGTGQLAGLSGTMKINIVDKKHFYDFEYTLP